MLFSRNLFALSSIVGLSVISSVVALSPFPHQLRHFYENGKIGCVSATDAVDGAPVVIHDCATEVVSKHTWVFALFDKFPGGPQKIQLNGTDKCLDLIGGVDADGTKLQVWTCADGNRNQQWTSYQDGTFKWADTNRCMDITDGSSEDGTPLQIWTCAYQNDNQRFSGYDTV